jgi:Beta-lactamase enzyme family
VPNESQAYNESMRISKPVAHLTFVALLAFASGCGSSAASVESSAASATTGASSSSSAPSSTSPPAVPGGGPARQRVEWLVKLINTPPSSPDPITDGFAPSFLKAITIDQLIAAVGSVVGTGTGWTITDDTHLSALSGEATITSAQGLSIAVLIDVESAAPHRIAGLRLNPVIPEIFLPGEPVTAVGLDAKLSPLAARTGYGLFDITGGGCRLIHGLHPDAPLALGSTFKLWILAALATEIEAGRATWDEQLQVNEAWKSSSDGEVFGIAAGTPVSLRRYAELMISISDNSATDHLLYRLGRRTVEAAMIASGVIGPTANIPLLGTRELFLLKYGPSTTTTSYLAGTADARRAELDGLLAGRPLSDLGTAASPEGPTHVADLEWFASPADLCRTHLYLAELSGHSGLHAIAEILKVNPGMSFDEQWTDVRFKGGSEPGVAFAAWRLERRDGHAYVIAGGGTDETKQINELRLIATLARAADLVPAT